MIILKLMLQRAEIDVREINFGNKSNEDYELIVSANNIVNCLAKYNTVST